MNKCFLELPASKDEKAFDFMMKEWTSFGGRINPGLLREYHGNYAQWLNYVNEKKDGTALKNDEVPQTLYLLKDLDENILGAASVRHFLNHTNFTDGGHVAYGITPSQRGRGYGKLILKLSLEKLYEMGIHRVLVTCSADNEASRCVILANGGVMENRTLDDDGVLTERYWL